MSLVIFLNTRCLHICLWISIHINKEMRFTAHTETVNGETFTMAAEVGLVSRNIKIEGEEYPDLYTESFGARVIVGITADTEQSYIGKCC